MIKHEIDSYELDILLNGGITNIRYHIEVLDANSVIYEMLTSHKEVWYFQCIHGEEFFILKKNILFMKMKSIEMEIDE
jgi:hypothetical protein